MATLILVAGAVVLIFASGWSPAAILVGGLLLVIALWRILPGRRVDNTPVTRRELDDLEATVRDHRGTRHTGVIRAHLGNGVIEVEDDQERRWVGTDIDKIKRREAATI